MENAWTKRIAELEKMVDNQRSVIESDEKLVEELTEKLKATEEEMLLWRRAGTNQTLQRQTDRRQAMSDVNKRLCELLDAEPKELTQSRDEWERLTLKAKAGFEGLLADYLDAAADRRREYGYSQQTVDALTLERDKLRAERNDWKARYQSVAEMHDALIAEFNEMRAENKRLCKRIAELEAENHRLIVQRDGAFERWKSAIAKYPNGADGCCCLFDDNENQVQWCTPHAELRDENDALTAERDKLKARVAELEAEMRER